MKERAFTLIEMLVAVGVLGILAGFVVIQTLGAIDSSKDSKRKMDIQLIANALVSYSSENFDATPVSTIACTINGTCSPTINAALEPFLATLPSDPDTDTYYTYQSDGTDCVLSAILSDGSVYQYSCGVEAMTTGSMTDGVCGSLAASYVPGTSTWPSADFCSVGTISSTPVFPTSDGTYVSWICPGEYLGSDTVCTAYRGQDGSCGSVANTSSTAYTVEDTAYPSSNYCSTGTVVSVPGFPEEGSSSAWTCDPLYAGSSASCSAYREQDGSCGTSNGSNYYTSASITNTCLTGTASSLSGTGPWTWSCSGINGGDDASCSANLTVDGVCGSSDGQSLSAAPTADLCSAGTASSVSGSGPWSWSCVGVNGGTTSSCTAALAPIYLCSSTTHTTASCTADGGTVFDTGSGCYACKFSGSACPTNWTQYSSWSTATTKTCYNGYDMNPCSWECVYPSCDPSTIVYTFGLACTANGHSWANAGVRSTCYYGHCGLWAICDATITEIGCY